MVLKTQMSFGEHIAALHNFCRAGHGCIRRRGASALLPPGFRTTTEAPPTIAVAAPGESAQHAIEGATGSNAGAIVGGVVGGLLVLLLGLGLGFGLYCCLKNKKEEKGRGGGEVQEGVEVKRV